MKKKGFTLVELLAVIVIIAVVALITIPMILNVIEDARKNSYKDSAMAYVDAIEKKIVKEQLKNTNTDYTGEYSIKKETITKTNETASLVPILDTISLKLKIKGTLPDKGNVVIDKKGVASGKFYYGDYLVTLNGEKYNVEIVTGDSTVGTNESSGDVGKTVVLGFNGSKSLTCNSSTKMFTNLTVSSISDNSDHLFSVSDGTITIKKAGHYSLTQNGSESGSGWRNMNILVNGATLSAQSVPTSSGTAKFSSSITIYLNIDSKINLGYWCSAANTMIDATLSVSYLHS